MKPSAAKALMSLGAYLTPMKMLITKVALVTAIARATGLVSHGLSLNHANACYPPGITSCILAAAMVTTIKTMSMPNVQVSLLIGVM